MMRIVPLAMVCLLFAMVSAQAGSAEPQQEQRIPTTLAEAHAELERVLPPETLAEIDAMSSEGDMIKYHFGLGMSMRNGWKVWQGGPLAQHLRERGFSHADDMSGVILKTFWCKRHGQDFRLEERAAKYKKHWDEARKAQENAENRLREAKAALRKMMLPLQFEKWDVPVVRIPAQRGLRVRLMCPFRDGVFLTVHQRRTRRVGVTTDPYYVDLASGEICRRPLLDRARGLYAAVDCQWYQMKPAEDCFAVGCYLDLEDGKIHRIQVAEVNEVHAAVVAGNRAWFAGQTDERAILVGISDEDRITVPLPQTDEIPDLGLDGKSLLAVYSKTIYRLTDRRWTLVHTGEILLPRSGSPPQRHGNTVFFHEEGRTEDSRRLWWLAMGEQLHLSVLDRNVGVLAAGPLRWNDVVSYSVTSNDDLWACAGGDSLFRRSQNGRYAIAIMNSSVRLAGNARGFEAEYGGVSVSAVTALPDDTLLLAGYTGLYRLKGSELVQELGFSPQNGSGKAIGRVNWKPNGVLALDDGSYLVSTSSRDGVYWLRPGDDGQWACQFAGEGEPVVW